MLQTVFTGALIAMENLAREYGGLTIRQRKDGFLDLTAIAQVGEIRLDNWWFQPSTLRYLIALAKKQQILFDQTKAELLLVESEREIKDSIPSNRGNSGRTRLTAVTASKIFPDLVDTKRGSPENGGGTWGHPKLGIRLAQEADEEFAVEVDSWVEEILTKGSVSNIDPQSNAGRALSRVMDIKCPWERLYHPDMCKKVRKWYGFYSPRFYWDYCYSWMTPEEKAKHEQNNPIVNGRRKDKVHQWIDEPTKKRLTEYVEALGWLIKYSSSRQEFEKKYCAEFKHAAQLDLFDLWGVG